MADPREELARRRLERQLVQEFLDRAEADREVVAMITVAEHSIEPRQCGRMPIDSQPRSAEPGAQISGGDRRVDARRSGKVTERTHGVPGRVSIGRV